MKPETEAPDFTESERLASQQARDGFAERERLAARQQATRDAFDARAKENAVKEFELRNPDIAERGLQWRVIDEWEKLKEIRLRSGQAIADPTELFDTAAAEVRRRLGLPTRYEQERNADLEEMQRERGKLKQGGRK